MLNVDDSFATFTGFSDCNISTTIKIWNISLFGNIINLESQGNVS